MFGGGKHHKAAKSGPPAVSREIHPLEPMKPCSGAARHLISAEMPPVYFETQQRKPVLQPFQSDRTGCVRQKGTSKSDPRQSLTQTPEPRAVKGCQDNAPFRDKNTGCLSQHLLSRGVSFPEIESMREDH